MTIIAGTTPTIEWTFAEINPADMTTALFTIKQIGKAVIEKDLTTATLDEGKMSWTLTQAESLKLSPGVLTEIFLDYVLQDGTRGAGVTTPANVVPAGKNEVI